MKSNWVRLLVWSGVLALVVAGWFWCQGAERRERERTNPWLRDARLREKQAADLNAAWQNLIATSGPVKLGTNWMRSFSIKAPDLTENEKKELAALYSARR
jgi:hypothetical protein